MRRTITLCWLAGVAAAAVLHGAAPASAESAGLHLDLNRQGKGAKIAWTTGSDPYLHMESQAGGRAWGFTRGLYATPADQLGLITYRLLSDCTDAAGGGQAQVFVRLQDAADRMYGRYYPCTPTSAIGATETVDITGFRNDLTARGVTDIVVGAVDFVVRERATADFDDMTITHAGGMTRFHDSASAAAVVTSRR